MAALSKAKKKTGNQGKIPVAPKKKLVPQGSTALLEKSEWCQVGELHGQDPDVLRHPVVALAFERVLERWVPRHRVALVSLCTSTRPYTASRKWKEFHSLFTGKCDLIVCSNGGIVPLPFEGAFPFLNYDAHGEKQFDKLYIEVVGARLEQFLQRFDYDAVIFNFRHNMRNVHCARQVGPKLRGEWCILPTLRHYELAQKDRFHLKGYKLFPELHPAMLDPLKAKVAEYAARYPVKGTVPMVPDRRSDWPAANVQMFPVDKLVPYANNARQHSAAQVDQIAASIQQFGWTVPALIAENGTLIAGHGRVLAAKQLDIKQIPVMVARGWSEAQRRAYTMADNQLALNATWDEALLRIELKDLQAEQFDLKVIGFPADELQSLLDATTDAGDGEPKNASLLGLIDITIAEPKHQPAPGSRWSIDGRHHLIVANVMTGWPLWKDLLVEDAIFCPYPGPFVTFSRAAKEGTLILIQPDRYIAGHILDRFAEAFGQGTVTEVPE